MAADPTFETALEGLETVVLDLESGALGLDEALARYESGVALLKRCHELLDVAGRKVALLTGVGPDGEPETAPFDASATIDRDSAAAPRPPAPKVAEADLDDLPF